MHHHIPAYARFQWINHPVVRSTLAPFFPYAGTGRRGWDKVTLFLWLAYRQLTRCSYRDLESMSGIDHSTFVKFKGRLKKRMPPLLDDLLSRIAHMMPEMTLVLDSSFVETYSGRAEEGSGYSGYKEANGYKLHTLLDFATRLPVLQCTTAGNEADVTHGRELVERAPPSWNVAALCADKGYDSEDFVMAIKERWKRSSVAIPVRHVRQSGDPARNMEAKYKDRSGERSLYRKRTEIERYFSRKKRVFCLGEERTWGRENFEFNCFFTSCLEILEWMAKSAL